MSAAPFLFCLNQRSLSGVSCSGTFLLIAIRLFQLMPHYLLNDMNKNTQFSIPTLLTVTGTIKKKPRYNNLKVLDEVTGS